ncbi:MAG TPA: SfiI family type II restriction endonuclease [Blastocatellia bacterium]|nr:SfiI family type II restriction endonuclease [Blastocatellia bacterium]
MFIDPSSLTTNLPRLEDIEKASMRLVTQAVYGFRKDAVEVFENERDLAQDIGEDITREALDRMGVSRIDQRLFGKVDYKRARYVFHPEYAIRQALFVDSKAEKDSARTKARIQLAQISMSVRQWRGRGSERRSIEEQGALPSVIEIDGVRYLATTIFVKYNYEERARKGRKYKLVDMIVAGIPNGLLQEKYNAMADDNIWAAGPNAPSRREKFRVRLDFAKLKRKENWRVQTVPVPPARFTWDD